MHTRRLAFLTRMARECGTIGTVQFGPQQVVLLNDPELIRSLLVDHADSVGKPPLVRQMAQRFLGQGILSVEGAPHRQQRKHLSPLFQHRHIAAYAPTITDYATQCTAAWSTGTLVPLTQAMHQLTLGIIGHILFGVDTRQDAHDVRAALQDVIQYTDTTIASLFPLPTWLNPQAWQANTALHQLDDLIARLIAARQRNPAGHQDFLSLIATSADTTGATRSHRYIRDEALTLLIAGHETTANAFTWTWYLLTQHPPVYQRLREEVDQVLAGRLPTVADIPHLSYTTQVIKESLRLYPPAYLFVREALQTIQLGSYVLPRGTIIAISPYTLHRRPQAFAHPERFDPDHFLPDAEAQRPRHAFLPFGVGPHHCIGQHLALLELQLGIATITQHVQFDLVPAQRVVPEPRTTLRPPDSLRMVVIQRS